jgi:hypothetical protein
VSVESQLLMDQMIPCEVEDGYILRVYGYDFIEAFLLGTHAELEIWAKPLRTPIAVQLDNVDYRLGEDVNYVEFYLDDVLIELENPVRCWASVWL